MTASGPQSADVAGAQAFWPGQVPLAVSMLPLPELRDNMLLVIAPCGHWWQGSVIPGLPVTAVSACGRCGQVGAHILINAWEEQAVDRG